LVDVMTDCASRLVAFGTWTAQIPDPFLVACFVKEVFAVQHATL
jgi:hypothetical protein